LPKVLEWEALLNAWNRVEENAGGPGGDVRLADLLDPKEDNVRYYRLCKGCLEQVTVVGAVPLMEELGDSMVGEGRPDG